MKIQIHNVKTGEITNKEMTLEEITEYQREQDKAEALRLAQEKAEKEKQALKDSANSKLLALGLSPEEIAAITGA